MESPTDSPSPPAASGLDRPVVLVGLMGAGKTSIGRLLAERLDLDFVDADAEIEAAAGCTIAEIFARHGEAEFRAGERRVIRRLLEGPPRVIATGGGAFMDRETRACVRARGHSIWLKAELDVLVRRVGKRKGRPLLEGRSPRTVLAELMAERDPAYATADITVETGDEPIDRVVDRVLAALEDRVGIPLCRSLAKAGTGNRARTGARTRNGNRNGPGNKPRRAPSRATPAPRRAPGKASS